jgi:hypothetical protein
MDCGGAVQQAKQLVYEESGETSNRARRELGKRMAYTTTPPATAKIGLVFITVWLYALHLASFLGWLFIRLLVE